MRIYIALQKPDSDAYHDTTTQPCPFCGDQHEKLWLINRVVKELMGHFPIVMLGGARVVIDQSLPTVVMKLPREATPLYVDDLHQVWTTNSESHVFGGPDTGKALRQAIKEANER